MKRYSQKALDSFNTKLKIYLFSKVIIEESLKITSEAFIQFEISDYLKEYEQYWQQDAGGKIRDKTVETIEAEVEELRANNSKEIKELEIEYRNDFKNVFPETDFKKLVAQKKCGYCKLTTEEFETLRKNGLTRKKHLTRGWGNLEIDRKQPNLEYTKENTIMSCYWCNNAKTDEFTSDEFEIIGLSIREIWLKRLKKKMPTK